MMKTRYPHWFLTAVLCAAAGSAQAAVALIDGSTGNGDFEASEPASGLQNYTETPNWFNAEGLGPDENINFTQESGTGGSSQSNSRAAFVYQSRTHVNDTGYTIGAGGEVFSLTYDFGAAGSSLYWDGGGDETMRTFLFTTTAAVDGVLTTADMTEIGGDDWDVDLGGDGQWGTRFVSALYTSTAADIGKTVYFGMQFQNASGANLSPMVDVIQLEVGDGSTSTNPPSPRTGWQTFVSDYGLSGDTSDDADADGQRDVVEFVHGGNPTNGADLAAEPCLTGTGSGAVSFISVETAHTNPGLLFAAEWMDDLTAGTWTNTWDFETNTPSGLPGYDAVERQVGSGAETSRFYRVKIADRPDYRPNILVVLADDLGYADVGFNGSPDIITPELDTLAGNGTVFTSAYVVHPFCGPSRMGLFAGRYPHEFGGPFNLPDYSSGQYTLEGISTNETLISTVLQDAGYYTGLMGKWHMGQQAIHHPNSRGFDDFYGFLGGGHNYFGPYVNPPAWDYVTYPEHNGVPVTDLTSSDYMTDVLSAEGVRFINEAATNNQPFFLFMSYNAPHTPLQAKASDEAVFPGITNPTRKTYAAMVYAIDRGVGELVDALETTGQLDETLIVFLSDNGGKLTEGANNSPLRGTKGDVWEGGFRVPMFMHWPGVVPAGMQHHHPVSALDFYPTFTRLAGAAIPPGKDIDGKDIWEALISDVTARPGESIYTVRYRIGFGATGVSDVGIRRDQWKAVRVSGANWKLYDIASENNESIAPDVSGTYPTILSNLVAEGAIWSQDHIRPQWFDSTSAEADWDSRGMPHFDTTFVLP